MRGEKRERKVTCKSFVPESFVFHKLAHNLPALEIGIPECCSLFNPLPAYLRHGSFQRAFREVNGGGGTLERQSGACERTSDTLLERPSGTLERPSGTLERTTFQGCCLARVHPGLVLPREDTDRARASARGGVCIPSASSRRFGSADGPLCIVTG